MCGIAIAQSTESFSRLQSDCTVSQFAVTVLSGNVRRRLLWIWFGIAVKPQLMQRLH